MFDAGLARFGIGFHVQGAQIDERGRSLGHQGHGFQRRVTHDGHHDVQLELAASGTAEGDRLVVADDSRRHLHQALAHDRVDLAGHDRAAGLAIRQHDFVKAAAGSRTEPADVVGDVEQRRRDDAQLSVAFDQAIALRVPLEVVHRFEESESRFIGQCGAGAAAEFGVRVDARSHGGAADRQFQHGLQRPLSAADAQFQLPRESTELLTQPQRRGIGQMSAADLDDLVPALRLRLQDVCKTAQGGDQLTMNAQGHRHMNRRWKRVVRALPHVDVVIGMHRLLHVKAISARLLDGAV